MHLCLRKGLQPPGIGLALVNGFDGLQTVNDATAKNYGNLPVCTSLKVKRPKPMNIEKSGEKA